MIKRTLIVFLVLLTLFVSLLMIRADDPWIYRNDDNGAWFSSVARAHLLKGLKETRGQDFFVSRKDGKLEPYLHHPPLPGLYLAALFAITGNDSPMTARFGFMLIHTLSFIIFFMIAGSLFEKNSFAWIWTLAVFAASPMSVFYGKMPNHEPLGLLFILCVFYGYILFSPDKPRRVWLIIFGASCAFAAALSSWHALFVLSGIAAYGCFVDKKDKGRYARMIWIGLGVGLIVAILQILWANDWKFLASQTRSFTIWTPNYPAKTLLSYFIGIVRDVLFFYGIIPALFAFFWLLGFAFKKYAPAPRYALLVIFAAAGSLLHGLLFMRAWKAHSYSLFYLLPFIAIESAWFIEWLRGKLFPNDRRAFQIICASAVAVTILVSGIVLHDLYTRLSDHAIRTTQWLKENYL